MIDCDDLRPLVPSTFTPLKKEEIEKICEPVVIQNDISKISSVPENDNDECTEKCVSQIEFQINSIQSKILEFSAKLPSFFRLFLDYYLATIRLYLVESYVSVVNSTIKKTTNPPQQDTFIGLQRNRILGLTAGILAGIRYKTSLGYDVEIDQQTASSSNSRFKNNILDASGDVTAESFDVTFSSIKKEYKDIVGFLEDGGYRESLNKLITELWVNVPTYDRNLDVYFSEKDVEALRTARESAKKLFLDVGDFYIESDSFFYPEINAIEAINCCDKKPRNLEGSEEDQNDKGLPDPKDPTLTDIEYWKVFANNLTKYGLANRNTWPIGLIVPTSNGVKKIPFPIIWKAVNVVESKSFINVLFLGQCGICPSPFLWKLDFAKNSLSSFVSSNRAKNIQIKNNTTSSTLVPPSLKKSQYSPELNPAFTGFDRAVQFSSVDTNPDETKGAPFKQDDLPSWKRLPRSNPANNPLFLSYVSQIVQKAKLGGGFATS